MFDEEEQAFLVFFASKVKCDGEETAKHRIYAAYTKDFVTFSDTFLYMERERDVIDTTILRSNGKYYRISKDETDSRLILEESDSLRGDFKRISCPVFEKLKAWKAGGLSFAGGQELVCDRRPVCRGKRVSADDHGRSVIG